jgi:hypothetical protein
MGADVGIPGPGEIEGKSKGRCFEAGQSAEESDYPFG